MPELGDIGEDLLRREHERENRTDYAAGRDCITKRLPIGHGLAESVEYLADGQRSAQLRPQRRIGRRPKRSDSGPITNWPTPKPMMNVDSTICGRLASARWKAERMLGSAGSIMSIASGFSAMMDAMMTTNSGKPIGRWPEE